MFKCLRLPGLVCLRALFCVLVMAGPALAVNYTVDPGAPVSSTNYHSLDDLRAAVTAWQSGDSITLKADDASLTQAFNFGAAEVSINGGGFAITPRTVDSYQFAIAGAELTLNGVSLAGFKISSSTDGVYGGAISGGAITLSGANSFLANTASGSTGYGGAISGSTITLSGANSFLANTASGSSGRGGAIYGADVTLSGGANTFSANTASSSGGSRGGAIASSGAITISGGANSFSANTASGGGGGGYGGAISGSSITISNGANTFSANTASDSGGNGFGGAIFGSSITISNGANTFSANTASGGSGYGGAISGSNVTISGGANSFSANTASGSISSSMGGAISGSNVTISGGANIFSGNIARGSASSRGGAINSNDLNLSGGVNTFVNNQTSGTGGAAYAYYGASLLAKDGDMLFAGNQDSTAATAKANALHVSNQMGNGTLNLAADQGRTIYFYDPVTSSNSNLTTNINGGPSVPPGTYTGTVVFDGSRYTTAADKLSAIYGATTVHGGTLALRGGAVYDVGSGAGNTFILGDGATLLSGVGSTINARQVDISPFEGATLAFDLTGAIDTSQGSRTTNLTINDSDAGPNSKFYVDITSLPGAGGDYKLATRAPSINFGDAQSPTITLRGEAVTNTRAAGMNVTGYGTNELTLNSAPATGVVTWLNSVRANNIWNASSNNWDASGVAGGTNPDKFLHGDAAVFNGGTGATTVQIQDGRETAPGVYQGRGVQIMARAANEAMTVNGGQWTFTGGAIDSVDGQVMVLGGEAVVAFGNETIAGQDTGSRTMHQRVRVASGNTATLKAADGAVLNFTGFKAPTALPENGSGGAIYTPLAANTGITLGAAGSSGTMNFTGNSAANRGGAIYAYAVNLNGGTNSFSANSLNTSGFNSSVYGGAIYGETVTLSNGTNSFSNNSASASGANSGAHGGAIYSSSAVSITGGTNSFINNRLSGTSGGAAGAAINSYATVSISGGSNTFSHNSASATSADGYGGAINTSTLTISGGTNTFSNNSASSTSDDASGGAISAGTLTISGGTNSFINNRTSGSSGSRGGAIDVGHDATLIAADGDMLFSGNQAGNRANALYMYNNSGNNTLTLGALAGRTIFFHDPIESNSSAPGLVVEINPNATHTGTVLFDRYHSAIYGNTTLYNGAMKLTGGAAYGVNNSTGSFTIKRIAAGDGLLADAVAPGNAIQAQTITLEDGAKISADMTRAVAAGGPGATTNLTLDGGIAMAANHKLIVNALHGPGINGVYRIITNPQGFAFSDANVTGLFDGKTEFVKPNPRYGDMEYVFGNGIVDLEVADADIARTATWTNATGDGKWNMTSQNWDLSGNPDASLQGWFKAGDDVIFAGAAQGPVVVDLAGVAPKNMTVSGGSHFFLDGPINGVNLSLTGGEIHVLNHFNFSEAMTVGKGAVLGLTGKGNLSPASIGPNSAFTLQNGGKLLVEPMDTAHVLRSGKIVFEKGSQVGLAYFGHGPVLEAGKHTALTLEAQSISNQSGIPSTSGEFIIGAYRYKYKNLVWDGNNLVMDVYGSGPGPDPKPDPVLSGVSALTGSSHIAALNPVFAMLNNRITGVFHELAAMPGGEIEIESAREVSATESAYAANAAPGAGDVVYRNGDQPNRFWFTPYYAYTDQSAGGGNVGYDLNTPALALGFERLITDSSFLGLAISVAWPEYDGDGTSIDATDFTLAAYGGAILPWANLELDAHAGYAWIDYDQTRRVEGQRYSSDYDGEMFFAGAGLGRTFWLNQNCVGVWLRPGVSYDYVHISTDGFDEGAGEFAIRMDDYDMDIHRLKAGLEAGYEFDSGFWVLGSAYYLGVYGDREATSTGHFVGDPVNGFDVVGNGLDENNLGLGAKAGLPIGKNWELNVGYDYLVGEDATTHQGSANITFRF